MIINELFHSLQGEGQLAGVPSIFIRLAGCPLRCRWCDTKYAWDASAGTDRAPGQIIEAIQEYPTRYVVVTGGEPLINDGLTELTCLLHQQGYHITIETSGIKAPLDLSADLMSISPKLSNSVPDNPKMAQEHEQHCGHLTSVQRLIETYPYQLKFVVDQPQDFDEVAQYLDRVGEIDPYRVYLMPQAACLKDYLEKSRWLAEYCLRSGFAFSPRLQVMLWEGQRGK